MSSPLVNRLKKGLTAQMFGQFITIFTQVVYVPLLLHFWGVELYGEWLILSAVPAYLAMSDVGFATAASHEMAMTVARKERQAALTVFHTTVLLIAGLSFLVFVVVAVAVFLVPLVPWLNLARLGEWDAALIVVLLSAHVLLNIQTILLYAGFFCEGNYGLGTFVMALIRLFEFALLVLAVTLGGGPTIAAGAFLIGRLLGVLGMRRMLQRVSPWIVYGTRHVDTTTLKSMLGPSFAFTFFPLGNALNLQGVVVVIGALLGPAAVVIFSALRTLTRFALIGLRLVSGLVHPEIATAFGKGDIDLVRRLHRHSCQAALWASIVVSVGLFVLGGIIFQIWTKGRVAMDWSLFCLLLLTVIGNALWFTSLMVKYATNTHQKVAGLYAAMNLLVVIATYGVVSLFGLDGVAVVLLLTEVFMALYVLPTSLSLARDRLPEFAAAILRPPLFLLGVAKEMATGGHKFLRRA